MICLKPSVRAPYKALLDRIPFFARVLSHLLFTKQDLYYIAYLGGDDFVYYFAHKGKRRTVEKSEYSRAWREYWSDKKSGMDSYTAIYNMIVHYGGVARKQAVPTVNAIYGKKIDEMLSYIEQSIENEIFH